MQILWMSKFVPYDGVAHAGGKIHNYLLKKVHKLYKKCFLISFAKEDEFTRIDLMNYGISYDISLVPFKKGFLFCAKKFWDLLFFFTVHLGFDSIWYIWRMFKSALSYKRKYGIPDIVILQWTSLVNEIFWLKILFPKSKFIAIEEDVTYLKKNRICTKSVFFLKILRYPLYQLFKRIELNSLKMSNLVVLNNEKDQKLVVKDGLDVNKTFVCHPFFQSMLHIECKHMEKNILFYGAMSRSDNYLSAIWFIEHVFIPKLEKQGFRFIVVGNKPHEMLKKYHNGESIQIVGFVEDISPFFEKGLCLVAPLIMGAGVKIKVLESMSAGLPVLTNEIGIEGIPAKDSEEYFLCSTPEEYEKRIMELASDEKKRIQIGTKAKEFIKNRFNYEKDADILCSKIYSLMERE